MIPVILYATTAESYPRIGKMTCNIMWTPFEGLSGSTFTLYSLTFGFVIPLCMILGFYYMVLQKLKTTGPKRKSIEKKRSHLKVTKLVLTVITVYILCWLPYWVSSKMKCRRCVFINFINSLLTGQPNSTH